MLNLGKEGGNSADRERNETHGEVASRSSVVGFVIKCSRIRGQVRKILQIYSKSSPAKCGTDVSNSRFGRNVHQELW